MVASSSDELDIEKQQRAQEELRRTTSRAESRHTVHDEDWAAGHDPITTTSSRVPDEGHPDDDDDDGDSDVRPQGAVGRVLSRITSKSSIDPGPPPDGGLKAWAQCTSYLSHDSTVSNWCRYRVSFGHIQHMVSFCLVVFHPPSNVLGAGQTPSASSKHTTPRN